ncbi:Aldo-keto reductase family 1 member B10 [Termitomyces sp. T112]|nr:Aldo-keto reductase family 1 member B10 [Termitomyces sp. T112]
MQIASRIIYGTAWKKEETTALVISAVLEGFRAIDTACQPKHYREDLVGEALEVLRKEHGVNREELFLQTKYTPIKGHDTKLPLPYNPNDSIRDQIQTSFQKSLANLKTTYLDSYLLHSPFKTLEQTLEAWHALMSLQDEGKVGMIGVSNTYDVNLLFALGRARKVQVVQNRWCEQNEWDRAVHNYCRGNNFMYQSFWTLTGNPSLLKHPALLAIAAASSCTPEQAVFKFVQHEGITPLSGTTKSAHMRQDLAVHELWIPEFVDESNSHRNTIRKFLWG